MEAQPDFKELLALLNKHRVEYEIVGGYALAFHGAPRYTGDLEVFVHATDDNGRRIVAALHEFGFGGLGLEPGDFAAPDEIVQLGVPPVRIDLITSLSGLGWEQAAATKAAGCYGDVPVFFIGRDALIINKRAIGRKKDLADLEALGEE